MDTSERDQATTIANGLERFEAREKEREAREEAFKAVEMMVAHSLTQAEASEAVAARFRPEFDACWERDEEGKMGKVRDQKTISRLYGFTISEEHSARQHRREAAQLQYVLELAKKAFLP
jgi:hypothetical protein